MYFFITTSNTCIRLYKICILIIKQEKVALLRDFYAYYNIEKETRDAVLDYL